MNFNVEDLYEIAAKANYTTKKLYSVCPEPSKEDREKVRKIVQEHSDFWDEMIDDAIDNHEGELPDWMVKEKLYMIPVVTVLLAAIAPQINEFLDQIEMRARGESP